MATSVTKFYANDGTEFPSLEAALAHELIKQLKDEFGFSDSICISIVKGSGRLHYLLGEYLKTFPEK